MNTAILRSRILDMAIHGQLTHSNTEEWESMTLRNVCSFQNGYAFDSHDYCKEGIPLIRIGNIQAGHVTFDKCVYVKKNVNDVFLVQKGDLLIAMSGASTGKIGIYEEDRKAYLNQRVGNIRVKDNSKIISQYRDLFLKSQSETIYKLAYGGAQPNISGKMILSLPLNLPSLCEQRRIVAKVEELLSEVETIEQAQADITQAATILRSRILDMAISGKLTHSNTDEWTWDTITNVTDPISSRDSQIKTSEILPSGKYAVVSQGQKLIDGYCDDESRVITTLPVILFGDHTRNVKFIDFPFVVGADGTKLHKCKSIDPKFCYYWILWVADNMTNRGYERHYSLLKQTPLHLPPLPEQRRIVAKVEELFAEIDKLIN